MFVLREHGAFDLGVISMSIRHYTVRMYDKDKPDKYIVIFFILADAKYYFIYHIDVYQSNNTANIDIRPSLHNLPTIQKSFADAIIKSGISNYSRGSRHLYMYNRYASPQRFSLMESKYNLSVMGKCRANRKIFESEQLLLE